MEKGGTRIWWCTPSLKDEEIIEVEDGLECVCLEGCRWVSWCGSGGFEVQRQGDMLSWGLGGSQSVSEATASVSGSICSIPTCSPTQSGQNQLTASMNEFQRLCWFLFQCVSYAFQTLLVSNLPVIDLTITQPYPLASASSHKYTHSTGYWTH